MVSNSMNVFKLNTASQPAPLTDGVKIEPGLLGFDIDGVVADTMEAFIRIALEDYRIRVEPEEITEFMVEECLDIDPLVSEEIFQRLLADPIGCRLHLMPGAGRVLSEFAAAAPLTFITARPLAEPIDRWLRRELGPTTYHRARLVATGEHDDKARPIQELGLRYFVDDRAQTGINLQREGIGAFIFTQPWNRGRHDLPTVNNWQEIRAICR